MRSDTRGFDVTILGSGTCIPSLKRSSCSVLCETGNAKLLFDIGAGTIRRLLENGTRVQDITHVFLSHFHPDHCGELVAFLFALKTPELSHDDHRLTLIGGKGLKTFFQGLQNVFGRWIDLGDRRFNLLEQELQGPGTLDLQDVSVRTAPVAHNPESLAYRIDANDRSFVYSGDTDVCKNLVTLARKADLLVCESSHPDDRKVDKHLSPSLAGKMATDACVKTLVLTHFYPECEKTDIAKECRKTYDGKLFLAEDLMKISL
jgi:ribonuclease BN (tRNA processing enzyme)